MSNKHTRAGTVPKHWYLAALNIGYVLKDKEDPDKVIGSSVITTNVLATPTTKKITQATLDDIRQLGLVKMRDFFNVNPEATTDICILNIAYLGMMSEKDFFEKEKAPGRNYAAQ